MENKDISKAEIDNIDNDDNVELDERAIQMLEKMREAMSNGAEHDEIIKIFSDFLETY